jgi:hypothetical protein
MYAYQLIMLEAGICMKYSINTEMHLTPLNTTSKLRSICLMTGQDSRPNSKISH